LILKQFDEVMPENHRGPVWVRLRYGVYTQRFTTETLRTTSRYSTAGIALQYQVIRMLTGIELRFGRHVVVQSVSWLAGDTSLRLQTVSVET